MFLVEIAATGIVPRRPVSRVKANNFANNGAHKAECLSILHDICRSTNESFNENFQLNRIIVLAGPCGNSRGRRRQSQLFEAGWMNSDGRFASLGRPSWLASDFC